MRLRAVAAVLVFMTLAAVTLIVGQPILPSHTRDEKVSSRSTMPTRENPQVVARQQTLLDYGKLPLSFEVNQGQTDRQVRFLAHNLGNTLYLTANEVVWVLSSAQKNSAAPSLRMRLLAANPNPRLASLDELPGKANYFTYNHPESWRTNVATYAKVKYEQIYRGVDLVFHGNGRKLEFDYLVAPGADPRIIRFGFDGAEHLGITDKGNLRLETRSGEFLLHRPLVYQDSGRSRTFIAAGYALDQDNQVRFQFGSYDVTRPLVIDPVLSYSTFLGGSGVDAGFGIAVDSAGNAYVTGQTDSLDFPLKNPPPQTSVGGSAFVTKLNATGTALVYSAYIDGQFSFGIAVDSNGNAYVVGTTGANNFPTTSNAFKPTCSNTPSGTAALAQTTTWPIAAVWIFNVWGAADLLFAFYKAASVRLESGSLGAGFYPVTAVVPLLLVSHALIFGLLIRAASLIGK